MPATTSAGNDGAVEDFLHPAGTAENRSSRKNCVIHTGVAVEHAGLRAAVRALGIGVNVDVPSKVGQFADAFAMNRSI